MLFSYISSYSQKSEISSTHTHTHTLTDIVSLVCNIFLMLIHNNLKRLKTSKQPYIMTGSSLFKCTEPHPETPWDTHTHTHWHHSQTIRDRLELKSIKFYTFVSIFPEFHLHLEIKVCMHWWFHGEPLFSYKPLYCTLKSSKVKIKILMMFICLCGVFNML